MCDEQAEEGRTARLSLLMFCVGVFALVSQVVFMREMLVVFFGNELSIAVILGCWLIGVGVGACLSRLLWIPCRSGRSLRWLLAVLLALAGLLLPTQVYLIRISRLILGVPPGELASLEAIFASAIAAFLPTSLCIGIVFPSVCRLLTIETGADALAQAVSRVYTLESLGSMVGGAVLTYLLLPLLNAYSIVFCASLAALIGAAVVAPGRRARIGLAALACVAATAACWPAASARIEARAAAARWRAFGLLAQPDPEAPPLARLLASEDSVYQNLAVLESFGQHSLYGNGQILLTFPDPMAAELDVHTLMAQKPGAKSVLLLGGNPIDEVPELLKYPLEKLVYVELDPVVGDLLARFGGGGYKATLADSRLRVVHQDGPRFVQRCEETFDVVIVHAPEPSTAGTNRFYTVEFFKHLRRLLQPSGFVCTSVPASARLQAASVAPAASVFRAIKRVFPVVLATAEGDPRFFAGGRESGLTFDRQTLVDRSRAAGVTTSYFRPEYLLGAEEIDPSKTAAVEDALSGADIEANTNLHPVAFFFFLVLWCQHSGSRAGELLEAVKSVDLRLMAAVVCLCGCLVVSPGVVLFRRMRRGASPGPRWRWWPPTMVATVLGITGFSAMAIQMLLVFVFQILYGYVYARMGLVVAVFMLGLVLGAPTGKAMSASGGRARWAWLAGLEGLLLLVPLSVPVLVRWASASGVSVHGSLAFELALYALVVLVAWAVGAQFPLGNSLFCEVGGGARAAVAVTVASDHLGAAAGCLAMGIVFVPIFGITSACIALALLKALSLACLTSAILASRA